MSSAPRKKKTFLVVLGSLGLLLACAAVGYYFYTIWAADRELQEAIAEADRLDPGWRLEELEANREVIPDAENGALKVLAIKKLIPKPWPTPPQIVNKTQLVDGGPEEYGPFLPYLLDELSPEVQLNAELIQQLRAELQKAALALPDARSMANYPRGRYQVIWSLDFISTPLPCQSARDVMDLLWHDARLRAQEGDIDGAITSDLGILNAGRSIGDEPTTISQLVRMASQRSAINTLERILAQGQPSQDALQNLQKNLEQEMSKPLLLYAVRGERAGHHSMMDAIEAGKLKVSTVIGSSIGNPTASGVKGWLEDFSGEMQFRKSHAPWILVMTDLVEIAKLPVEQQRSKLKAYAESIDQDWRLPVYVRLVVPSITRPAEGFARNQAWLRCALVAIATERYRQAHNRWPESLEQLVPESLQEVPLDPYDGKPLRFRRLEDGVVIYSIGPDEKDDGGKLSRQFPIPPGTDLGFQLWDVNRRRQPWRPPPKADRDEDN